jgi:hypothetical protein
VQPAFVVHGADQVDPLFRGRVMRTEFPAGFQDDSVSRFRLSQTLVPRGPNGEGPSRAWRGLWARANEFRGKRLVAACWVWANYLDAVTIGFVQAAGGSRANWRAGDWLLLTTFYDYPGRDYPQIAALNPPQLELTIEVVPPKDAMNGVATVLVGAPQINIGPDLFPVGPTFAGAGGNGVLAPIPLSRGFIDDVPIRLTYGQTRASTVFASDAVLERIHVDAHLTEGRPARYALELVQGMHIRVLSLISTGDAGEMRPGAGAVALHRGDRIRVRLLEGEPLPLTVHLQTVHSKVV